MFMEKIKIYYKGEHNEQMDNILKDAMGCKGYVLIGSGYNFKTAERDLEFVEQVEFPHKRWFFE